MTAPCASPLDGSVALVTGGTRGIGREVARGLGRAGTTVVLVGRDAGRVEQAVAELLLEDVDATGRAVDVADPPPCRRSPRPSGRSPRSTSSSTPPA